MAQQAISRQNTTSVASPPVDVWMAKELSFRRSAMIDGRLHEPLPSIIRGKMENRRAVVMASTRSATRSETEEVVAALMMAYPSMRGLSHIEAQVLIRKYADDLADMPLWAIKAAARDISRGAVSDMSPDFAPSAPRVRQLADEHLEWCKKELRDLKVILTAEVEPPANPEVRARITLGFQKLQQAFGSREVAQAPVEPPPSQAPTAEQLRKHYERHGLGFAPKPRVEEEAAE
jgi:hypothetical protein